MLRSRGWHAARPIARLHARGLSSLSGGGGGGGGSSIGGGGGLGAVTSGDEIPTLKLYRDCMRLTYHIAAASAKGDAMRAMIRSSFRAQAHVTDAAEIARLKMLAVVGLQNYVIHEQTGKAINQRKNTKNADEPKR